MRKSLLGFIFASVLALAPLQARAGIPVIDVTAIANLIEQIMYWQKQIVEMKNQLQQLKNTYDSVTGNRGMGGLVPMSNLARNYLPPDYVQLMDAVNGMSSGSYAGLSTQVKAAMAANAILTAAQMADLSPEQRKTVEEGRRAVGMLGGMSRSAYQNTSQRFAKIQQLMDAINGTTDQKGILELQARIDAEQGMLANEQNKLQTLYQIAQAEQWNQQQRIREQIMSGHGKFESRLQPSFGVIP